MKRALFDTIRIAVIGIGAAIAWGAGLILIFGPAQAILADPDLQSAKFLSVFSTQPLPRMAEQPILLPIMLWITGCFHAGAYVWVKPRLHGGILRRGASFGLLSWALMVPWFELYLPWNVMREPAALVLLEAFCWVLVLVLVGISIATIENVIGPRGPEPAAR